MVNYLTHHKKKSYELGQIWQNWGSVFPVTYFKGHTVPYENSFSPYCRYEEQGVGMSKQANAG